MLSNPLSGIAVEPVRIHAVDGFELSGTLFRPDRFDSVDQTVLFNCGGGVAAFRYRHFAAFLAKSGIPALLYDYRGIGASRPPSLRAFDASLEDWSEYDCAGAIDWLCKKYPGARLIGVGHSIGNLIFGGAKNAPKLSRLIMICPHTGFLGDCRVIYWLPMAVIWHGVMPLLTHVVGYFPASQMGLGDDIPKRIALQWAGQLRPGLRSGATDSTSRAGILIDRCKSLNCDATLLTFSDDAFATPRGAKRLISYFPGLEVDHQVLSPKSMALPRIGHFGILRRPAADSLWPWLLALILRDPQSQVAGAPTSALRDKGIWPHPGTRIIEGFAIDNRDADVAVRQSST